MVVRDETDDDSRSLNSWGESECGRDDRPCRLDEEEAAELLEGTEVMKRLLADMPVMREDHRRRVRSVSHSSSHPFPSV